MTNVGLTVLERVNLLALLPSVGNITTLRVIMDAKKDMGFSEEEIKRLGLSQSNSRIMWDLEAEGDSVKQIEIGDTLKGVIVDSLQAVNAEEKMTVDLVPLWDRFVEEEAPPKAKLEVVEGGSGDDR